MRRLAHEVGRTAQSYRGICENSPYGDTWESLCGYPVPKWYADAKFGIFIHWGVYSVPAFGSEWYPHHMYIKGRPEYDHHVKTYGEHALFGYKDFIPMFRGEKFDPAAWMDLFAGAGAKYVMPVAEHHDGFKMYKSDISKWNAAEMGPCRDVVGELKAEADKRGIKLCCSNHRAEHFWFFSGGLEIDSDVRGAGYDDFYGPPHAGPGKSRQPDRRTSHRGAHGGLVGEQLEGIRKVLKKLKITRKKKR